MTHSGYGSQREIKMKGQKLGALQASNTKKHLFQMMAQNRRFSKE